MRIDKVHTVIDFFDRPRSGLADFEGAPHVYDCIFDEARDEYSERYRLIPTDRELAGLMKESWKIWLRWSNARHQGRTPLETHPTLPRDRARHDEIAARMATLPQPDMARAIVKQGLFSPRRTIWFARADSLGNFSVRWVDPLPDTDGRP
jgi:hypothetical protein